MSTLPNPTGPRNPGRSPFDAIRHVVDSSDGTPLEYWSARELYPVLGYGRWGDFAEALDRGRAACRNGGYEVGDHFREVPQMVDLGSGARRSIVDVQLTRLGCYLVAMNGDPRKAEIAAAQRYFAFQTYRAEQLLPPAAPPPVAPPPPPAVRAHRPWAERFRQTFMPHVRELHNRYPGCFTVVSAVVTEIIFIEDELVRHLMETRGFDRPDISIGMRYATFRREDMLLADSIRSAPLYLIEQDRLVDVKVYDGGEWPMFQRWFRDTYLPEHLGAYLDRKPELKPYPRLTRFSAADNASLALGGRPAVLPPPLRAQLDAAGGFAPARALPGGPPPRRQLPPSGG